MTADQRFILGLIVGAVWGMCAATVVTVSLVHESAVEHRVAHYDPLTAEFEWGAP